MDITHLKDFIAEVLPGTDLSQVDEDSVLRDLGLDSLDLAQIVFSVESELGIETDPEELEKLVTVGDALKLFNDAGKVL